MSKIKIAFITMEGLNAGGTERFLQTIAANLPKDRYEVDYYYTPKVAQHRYQYMVEHNVIQSGDMYASEKLIFGRYIRAVTISSS